MSSQVGEARPRDPSAFFCQAEPCDSVRSTKLPKVFASRLYPCPRDHYRRVRRFKQEEMPSRGRSRSLPEHYRCLEDFELPDWPEGIDSVPEDGGGSADLEASSEKDRDHEVFTDDDDQEM